MNGEVLSNNINSSTVVISNNSSSCHGISAKILSELALRSTLFHHTLFFLGHQAEILPKIKDILRTCPASDLRRKIFERKRLF